MSKTVEAAIHETESGERCEVQKSVKETTSEENKETNSKKVNEANGSEVADEKEALDKDKGHKEAKANEDDENPEEEVTEGNWTTPQVEVKEVEVVTGEEDEELFWTQRAKLYRYAKNDDDVGEWKERGLGDAKLLRHKKSGKIRFLLRQEKTLKIVANHYVIRRGEFCKLVPNVSSDKIYVWTVNDYSDEEAKLEQFALKFGTTEKANEFKIKFEEAAEETERSLDEKDKSP